MTIIGISTQEKKVLGGKKVMLEPLYGNVLLQKEVEEKTTKSGIILTDESKEKPSIAKVIACGEGRIEDGKVVPMKVKEGDTVVFKKYSGTEFEYEKEKYLIVSEEDILAIVK